MALPSWKNRERLQAAISTAVVHRTPSKVQSLSAMAAGQRKRRGNVDEGECLSHHSLGRRCAVFEREKSGVSSDCTSLGSLYTANSPHSIKHRDTMPHGFFLPETIQLPNCFSGKTLGLKSPKQHPEFILPFENKLSKKFRRIMWKFYQLSLASLLKKQKR